MKRTYALALAFVCAPCWSQSPPAAAPSTSSASSRSPAPSSAQLPEQVRSRSASPARVVQVDESVERGEPLVKHTVIEDDGSKIDERRVRGQLTQVVVTPKVGLTKSYEIIMSRSGREPVEGTGGANSAAGKRVWNVLAF